MYQQTLGGNNAKFGIFLHVPVQEMGSNPGDMPWVDSGKEMLNNHGGGARNSPWGKPQVRISFRQTNHWQDSDLFAPCRQREEVDPFIQHGCQTFVGGGLTAHIGKVHVRRFGLDFGGFQHRSARPRKGFVRKKGGSSLKGE